MKPKPFDIRGLRHPEVLAALNATPRHLFVPPDVVADAYQDRALSIGSGQTISQPYVVAMMTDLLDPSPDHRILEIGSGSGYQAAVLARLVAHVFTVECIPELQAGAQSVLQGMGLANVTFRLGDGSKGWPEEAPFDGIIVTAAAPEIVPAWLDQLKPDGRLVMPLGPLEGPQDLVLVTRQANRTTIKKIWPVKFVPLTHPD